VDLLRIGVLGTARKSATALLGPAASVPEVTGDVPTSAAHAVTTMRLIDDAYRAAGLLPRGA